MEVHRHVDITVPETDAGARLDKFLSGCISDYSRVQLRRAITNGEVLVDGKTAKPSYRLFPGQSIQCKLLKPAVELPTPENIPLDIIYEDEYLVAINKPSAMVVHPAKGHWKGTLVSALSHHFQSLSQVGGPQRPGIIHRLDRDTTGVIVIAKTDLAHKHIASQFENRTTIKEYLCLTLGIPDRDRDNIDLPIGPHSYQRERMAVRLHHPKKRNAQTFYEVQERFRHIALVKAAPQTGRTHQIRVHLAYLGYPILADKLYGGKYPVSAAFLKTGRDIENDGQAAVLTRQALHACRLTIAHPKDDTPITFEAPLPNDLIHALKILRKDE